MLTVNGTDLSTVGFRYATRRLPGLGGQRSTIQPVAGGTPILLGTVREAGSLQVDGWFTGASHAELLTRRDALVALVRGELVLRFADITDREWVGRLAPASRDDAVGAAELADAHKVTLQFELPSAAARAQTETVTAGTNPALVLGTAPSYSQITVQNGAGAAITQVIVQVRDGTTVLEELEWDGSVASGDALVIRSDISEIANDGANAIDGMSAGSTFPIADPELRADNILVSITGGTGVTVETRYRRRWW